MSKPRVKRDDIIRVIECFKVGLETREISEQTGVNIRTVQRLIRKHKASGSGEVPTHGKGGIPPRKVSPRSLPLLKRIVDANPTITAKQLKEQNPLLLGEASVRTVQRRLHEDLKFSKVKARKKPLVTDRQKAKRLAFAKKYSNWDISKWR